MKKHYTMLFSVVTVIVIGFGLFLPRMVSSLQNRRTTAHVQKYPVKTIQLDAITPVGVFSLLDLMSDEHTSMPLESGGVLGKEEVVQYAYEALGFIEDYVISLDLEQYTMQRQNPLLVFSGDGEDSALLWQCEFFNTTINQNIVLYLDDDTGKMVSFRYTYESPAQPSASLLEFTAEKWAHMCVAYYGFESSSVTEIAGVESIQQYQLSFAADDGSKLLLPLRAVNFPNATVSDAPAEYTGVVVTGNVKREISFNYTAN